MDVVLQSRTPKTWPWAASLRTAAGHGCLKSLLLTLRENGGITSDVKSFSMINTYISCILSSLLLAFPAFGKEVKITLVQANDVYEIAPTNGGQFGGLARLQTLIK